MCFLLKRGVPWKAMRSWRSRGAHSFHKLVVPAIHIQMNLSCLWIFILISSSAIVDVFGKRAKNDAKSSRVFLYPSTARRILAVNADQDLSARMGQLAKRALDESRLIQVHLRGILYTAGFDADSDAPRTSVNAASAMIRGYSWLTKNLPQLTAADSTSGAIPGPKPGNASIVTPEVLADRLSLFRTDAVETPKRGGSIRLRIWPSHTQLLNDTEQQSTPVSFGVSRRVNVDARKQPLGKVTVRTDDDGYFDAVVFVELVDNAHDKEKHEDESVLPENWVRMPASSLVYNVARRNQPRGSAAIFYLNAGILATDEKEGSDSAGYASVGLTVAQAPVVVLDDRQPGLMVITDIDDTIKVSNITGTLVDIAASAFMIPYVPVDEMVALFRNWTLRIGAVNPILRTSNDVSNESVKAKTVPISTSFHYVTGVSWPLVPSYFSELLHPFGFPVGSIWARSTLLDIKDSVVSFARRFTPLKQLWRKLFGNEFDFRVPSDSSSSKATKASSTYQHKMISIQNLLDGSSHESVVIMLGDSTQYDPEVYADVTRLYGWVGRTISNSTNSVFSQPGRISCIFIRAVVPLKNPPSTDITPVQPPQTTMTCADLSETEKCMPSRTVQEQVFIRQLVQRLRIDFSGVPGFEERVRVFRTGADLASVDVATGKCY